jgi:hypothetical protein
LTPSLFSILPDYVVTPDGMQPHPDGDLVLSCPNFADEAISGVVVRITRTGEVTKWFDVPRHPETGVARNMGLALGPDGTCYLCDNQGWSGEDALAFKGRLLAVRAGRDGVIESRTVAWGMEHPNGVRIKGRHLYVTQSLLTREQDPSGQVVSGVYRFDLEDDDVFVTNTREDPQLIATFTTRDPEVQYGADGIVFGPDASLYVGNFGDGEVYRITFDARGEVRANQPFARDPEQLRSTDGMIFDELGNLYVADFSANALARVRPEGQVTRIAESPDSDGLGGELNQPGEPVIFDGRIIASCFDLVTGPDKVNTGHSLPATLCQVPLAAAQAWERPT